MSQIKIVIAGPRGNMGKEAVKMVEKVSDFELLAVVDSKNNGKMVRDLEGLPPLEVPVYEQMEECLQKHQPDVLIDLTNPKFGRKHMEAAFKFGVSPVVGTTGFTDQDLLELDAIAKSQKIGAIIAPNFAIGAILMMKFAQTAAKYMPDVEIIERHHDRKLDAPSGTAIKTAQLISEVREKKNQGHPEEREELAGARGADYEGMKIHSVRQPGLVAHQEVVFGSVGQTLTIRHDSINRESFMPGIELAVRAVKNIESLVYGLEHLID
ncbi:dihydrodipicolinate reductase [Bacillus sp. TS-2]|nr:dihydrodipicolinate reductase [Bacillus sp. TS-2]